MANDKVVSFDTNIIIVGLQCPDSNEARILRDVDDFNIIISSQVEVELRRNFSNVILSKFYRLIYSTPAVEIIYDNPPENLILKYSNKGLKKGDILIAAFCEWYKVDIFVSENRHFLQQFPDTPFQIMSAEQFCNKHLNQ